jgi:hypothetical protein
MGTRHLYRILTGPSFVVPQCIVNFGLVSVKKSMVDIHKCSSKVNIWLKGVNVSTQDFNVT